MANLSSCHSLGVKIKHQRASVLYLIGRTLRIVADLSLQLREYPLNSNTGSSVLSIVHTLSKWSPLVADAIKSYQPGETDVMSQTKVKSKISKMPSGNEIEEGDELSLADNLTASFIQSNLANIVEQENLKVIIKD